MNKYKELFNNVIIFSVGNFISKAILFCMLPLYTRLITSSDYGLIELVTTFSQMVVPLFSLAISEAVYRFCLDEKIKNEVVLKNAFFVLLLSSILLLFSCFFLSFYKKISDFILFYYFISLLTMFRNVFSLYTQSTGLTKLFAIDNILYNVFLAGLNIFFLLILGYGINGYFLALIVANLISIIILVSKNSMLKILKNTLLDKKLLKKMLMYSTPLIFNSLLWLVFQMLDRIMLAEFFSTSATGIYSVAIKIPALVSLLSTVFTQAWGISAIKDFTQEKDKRFFSNIFEFLNIFLIIFVSFVLLINNNVIPFVLGSEFEKAAKYAPLLLAGSVFLAYSGYFSPVLQAAEKTKYISLSSFVGTILNIILNLCLIPKLEIMGACLATFISYLSIAAIRMLLCQKIMGQRFCDFKFFLTLFIFFIESFCTIFMENNILIVFISLCVIVLINIKTITHILQVSKKMFYKRNDYAKN